MNEFDVSNPIELTMRFVFTLVIRCDRHNKTTSWPVWTHVGFHGSLACFLTFGSSEEVLSVSLWRSSGFWQLSTSNQSLGSLSARLVNM